MSTDQKLTAKPLQRMVVHTQIDRPNTAVLEMIVMGETHRFATSHEGLRKIAETLATELAKLDGSKPN